MIPVGLKYITNRQVLEVPYESQRRRFILTSIIHKGSPDPEVVDSLTRELGVLSLDVTPQIGLVTWDTTVSILESDAKEEPALGHKVGEDPVFGHIHLYRACLNFYIF